jgi:putative endonuclease
VLRSRRDGHLYKGVAEDVEARIAEHNSGKAKSLRHRRWLELVYVEKYATRDRALARERWPKTLSGGRQLRKLMPDAGSPARPGPARAAARDSPRLHHFTLCNPQPNECTLPAAAPRAAPRDARPPLRLAELVCYNATGGRG